MFTRSHRSHLRACCRAVGVLVLIGHGLAAQADKGLSLDHALQIAQQRSLQVVAQDAAAASAREMAVAAGQRPDPQLRVSVDALPINGPNRFSLTRDDFTMATIGVTQELTRASKRQARSARFEREAASAEASRARGPIAGITIPHGGVNQTRYPAFSPDTNGRTPCPSRPSA